MNEIDGMDLEESFMKKNNAEDLIKRDSNMGKFDVNISVINKPDEQSKLVDDSELEMNFMMGNAGYGSRE